MRTSPIFYPQALSIWKSVCRMPYSFFLDSCHEHTGHEWSFLGWSPSKVMVQYPSQCRVITAHESSDMPDSIFYLASQELAQRQAQNAAEKTDFYIPFSGGMVGYFNYESASFFSDYSFLKRPEAPLAVAAFFDHGIAIHHSQKSAWYFETQTRNPAIYPIGLSELLSSQFQVTKGRQLSKLGSPHHEASYANLIQTLKTSITNGDIYQANLTHRFSATGEIDPILFYDALRQTAPAPYCALINLGFGSILSASPERFFNIKNNAITCNPIKGTRPRHPNTETDNMLKNDLLNSPKDSAELLMITDLIRNDLGRICQVGSINVPSIQQLTSLPQVHHLYATITGQLNHENTLETVFNALFPCGSISGAPKIRAMQLLSQLESVPRNIYTGAIGYWSDNGCAEFNVAIRTLYGEGNRWYFHTGGGIVADSDSHAEWQETLDKSAGIVAATRNYNGHVSTPSLRFS